VRYTIEFRPAAARDFRKLSKHDQRRIGARIESLAVTPRPAGVKQLAASEKLYRIRVGDYRILYQILDRVLRVLVVEIGHRRDVYR
jgi:mRNA interferase RelE/StbE